MRRLVPLLMCLAVAGACAFGVVTSAGLQASGAASTRRLTTPVLSARRVPSALQSLAADGALRQQLDAVVARSQPATCLVVALDGRTIYAHAPAQALLPASNEKLLTATAVLHDLGPTARLRTTVRTSAAPDATGTVHGDLYLVGGGDPLLTTDAYRATQLDPALATRLEQLADDVVATGVRHLAGRVIGDESRYDAQRTVATWQPNYVPEHQSGPLSALTVNDNWATYPWKDDPGARVTASPAPATTAASLFALLLTQRGVTVAAPASTGTAPSGLAELAHIDSLPISDIVREMLTESDNQTAEMLLKELGLHEGRGGSTAGGLAAMRATLTSLGLSLAGTTQTDGSGLDRGNRVTCTLLVQVLDLAGPLSPLSAGLAVAGKVGTLKAHWLRTAVAGRLRAKTGTLDDVNALSGYVSSVPGDLLTFAYITNGKPKTAAQAAAENDLGLDMVGYPVGVDPKGLMPEPVQ